MFARGILVDLGVIIADAHSSIELNSAAEGILPRKLHSTGINS